MNSTQLTIIAHRLLGVAGMLSPGTAPAVSAVLGVVQAASELRGIINEIRNNPDTAGVWAKVAEDYEEAVEAFRQSVEQRGQ